MKAGLFLFKALNVPSWPSWARRIFVLSLLPRRKLADLPFTIKFGDYRYSGNATNLIDYHMLSRGEFEPGLAKLLRDWARRNPESIFLDVGANLGVHTLALAPIIKRILAVEPFSPVADRLTATLAANGIDNVSVMRIALSDRRDMVSFQAPGSGNLGVGRIVEASDAYGLLKVAQETGDAVLEAEPLPLSLVKIDVEGHEIAVLNGLKERLRQDRPLIVFEVLTSGSASQQAIKNALPNSYSTFRLKNARRKNYRVEPWRGDSGDIIAVPAEAEHFLARP